MHPLLRCCSLLFLVFDLSVCTLQLFSSPDTNGSYCPGKVTFTCVGTDIPIGVSWRINGSIIHTYTFPNQGDEMFPEILFTSDIFTITVKSASFILPATHNITLELSGNVSNLLQSTVSCRTAAQNSESFFILPSVSEIPSNIMVDPVYNFSTRSLSKINVFWNVKNGLCMDYSYQVILSNGSSILRSENVNCRRDTKCQVMFMIATSKIFDRYIVQVVTLDFQGLAINTSILPPVDRVSSFLPNISVGFFPCFIRCYSDPNLSGTCEIDFPDVSVNGTVNSGDIEIPESLQSGTVNFNATFNIGGRTYTFQNSTDVQYDKKWTAGILFYAILVPALCVLSIILVISFRVVLCMRKADDRERLCNQVFIVCTTLLTISSLLISLSCWIAGLVEVSKTDNCGSVDLPQNILIAAFIISFLSVIIDGTAIVLVLIYWKYRDSQRKKESLTLHGKEFWQKEEGVKDLKIDKLGMLVDEHGNRVIEDEVVTSGHRNIGEKLGDARTRVADEHTREAIALISNLQKEENVHESETESNVYSQTEHVGPSSKEKKKPKQESNYSSMGRKPAVSPEDKHYAKLQHNSTSAPPAGAPPNVFTTATTSSGSMPLSTQAGYSQVGTQPSELPSNVNKAERSGSGPEYGKLEPQEIAEQQNASRNQRRKAEEKKKKGENVTTQET